MYLTPGSPTELGGKLCRSPLCYPYSGTFKDGNINHTHTHTLGFQVLWGHSVGIMDLYCTNSIFCPLTLTLPLTQNFLLFKIYKDDHSV